MKIPYAINANPQATADNAIAVHKNRFSVSRTAGTMPVYSPKPEIASYADDGSINPNTSFKNTSLDGAGLGFKDLLDVINPLQQLPIIGTLYRKITGDEISSPARIAGGALYGGPIGGVLALADVAIKGQTGSTVGDKMFNLVSNNPENEKSDIPVINLTPRRSFAATRMAGTVPVWQGIDSINPISAKNSTLESINRNIS